MGSGRARTPHASSAAPARKAAPPPNSAKARVQRGWRKVLAFFPPVRLVWIFLLTLFYLSGGLAARAGWESLFAVIGASVAIDLGFQWGRYGRLRFPDGALAVAGFLMVLLDPTVVTLPLVAVVVTTHVLRQVLRSSGRPWFNPTALGLTVGFFVIGTQVPWAVGTTPQLELVMLVMGLLLILRQRSSWRLPFYFFVSAMPLLLLAPLDLGGAPSLSWSAFLMANLSPLTIFFGLFMVPEPRTAPPSPRHMWIFAVLVGELYAFLPLTFTTWTQLAPIGAITPFLALFAGNIFTVLLRAHTARQRKAQSSPGGAGLSPARPQRMGGGSAPVYG